jgi:hypothetical protein
MISKENKSIKIDSQVKALMNDVAILINSLNVNSNRFNEYYKETTSLELSKLNKGELIENDVIALAFSIAKKHLQSVVKQNDRNKISLIERNSRVKSAKTEEIADKTTKTEEVADKTTKTEEVAKEIIVFKTSKNAIERIGKFVESIMVHNRAKQKQNGNGAIGSIFINATVLRREGNFNANLVNRFINNEYEVSIQGKNMLYSDILKELNTFGIDRNFNNILRNGLKGEVLCEEILKVVKANYAIQ